MSTTTPLKEKEFPNDYLKKLPKPFILRRLHSFLGIWLSLYLFEHLLVNSQAALFFFDEGSSFIRLVNQLEDLPFLPVIELVFLGLPFFIHMVWGVIYLKTAKYNAHKTDGSQPQLPQFRRNRAYSWQRITSWILLVGVLLHVVQMRIIDRPRRVEERYFVTVKEDRGLSSVIEKLKGKMERQGEKMVIETNSAGAAFFLVVRDMFKNPLLVILYSVFVIAACYHGFNGLWTFMITWGITLTRRSQKRMRTLSTLLMTLTIIMGLLAAWGTYWTTLFQL